MMPAILTQLSVSTSGMPKFAVLAAEVTRGGVAGDKQRNLKHHGGEDRAICLYSEELYDFLREKGVNLKAGDVGENFTTRGLNLLKLESGDRLRVGGCVIEITKVRVPCSQLRKWDSDLPELIVGYSGWMAKVVEEGIVKPGDGVEIVERGRV